MTVFLGMSMLLSGCVSSVSRKGPQESTEPVSRPEATENDALDPQPPFEPIPEWTLEGFDPTLGEPVTPPAPEDPTPYESLSSAPHDELSAVEPNLPAGDADLIRRLAEEESPGIDFPIVVNDKVLFWIDYYSKRHPKSFQTGLVRSGRYIERFKTIFREAGLPEDMVYFAHVESAYKTSAYSRARAKGVFQFIAATGKRYDLDINYWVDERSDPELSARASAAFLKDLYDEFGDLYLALAGYNAGEGKIRRALKRSGEKDFWGIAKTRHIRRETKNYVPAIIAAILISKDPEQYGFHFTPEEPLHYDTVSIENAVDLQILAECAGVEVGVLRALNPALRRNQTPPSAVTELRIPVGTGSGLMAALENIPESERVLYVRYRVRRGDSLSTIARKYGVTVYGIQQANGMGRRTMIGEGKTLLLPTSSAARFPASARTIYDPPADGEGMIQYRVRRGDNLWTIASRYGTTTSAIAARSGISEKSTLRIGQQLKILPRDRSAPTAAQAKASQRHRVRSGDSLWDLSRRYHTTPRAIAEASGISTRSTLKIGQMLTIPGSGSSSVATTASYHTVRRGDTLSQISRRYRVSVKALCRINSISTKSILHPGNRINLR